MSEPRSIDLSSRQTEERRIVSVWLRRLEELLHSERALYESALKRAGLNRETLEETVNLSQRDLDRVLAQVRTRHPDITLRLFSRAEILDLGLVGYAAINSDSVGSALQIMNQYHSLASDRYLDELALEGDTARIAPAPLPGYADDFQNICEDSFSGNWRALQLLLGPHAEPSEIRIKLPYAPPRYAGTYHEIFGEHCEFQSSTVGLSFPSEWLSRPIHYGSGALSDVYAAVCERVLGPGEISRWHRVHHADESWCCLAGDPLALLMLGSGPEGLQEWRLQPRSAQSLIVPAGVWQAARALGRWSLMTCAVAPGFDFADFQLLSELSAAEHPPAALPEYR